jgi:hypothetical protein
MGPSLWISTLPDPDYSQKAASVASVQAL